MILVISGEGPTDLGTRRQTEAGWEFVPGPMVWIVDRLLRQPGKLNYSLLELHANGGDCVLFLSEGELSALRPPRPLFLPRGEDADGNQYFRKGAYLLGKHAKAVAGAQNSPVIAILFRDADGTRSTPKSDWQRKFDSMQRGFHAAEFHMGVPMVPRPKSEAWMLCGLLKRENPEIDCNWLEEEPGNDASPKSLKAQLSQHLGGQSTAEQQADLVKDGQINPQLIDLPSFTAFGDELDRAYANTVPQPYTPE